MVYASAYNGFKILQTTYIHNIFIEINKVLIIANYIKSRHSIIETLRERKEKSYMDIPDDNKLMNLPEEVMSGEENTAVESSRRDHPVPTR